MEDALMRKVGVVLVVLFCSLLFAQDKPKQDTDTTNNDEPTLEEINLEIRKVKQLISFLNLFNGLHLSEEQLEELIKINEEYKADLEEYKERARERMKEWLNALNDWEKALENGELPKDLMHRAGRADFGLAMGKKKMEDLKLKYKGRLETVFTDAQKEIIKDFAPCVIPPKNLKDPVRVGQASVNDRFIKELRRLRRVPRSRFHNVLDKVLQRHPPKHIIKKHRMTEEEVRKERERVRKLLIKVYNMDDTEFELNKEKLAEELKFKSRVKELHEEIRKLNEEIRKQRRKENPGSYGVLRWFLKPSIIPILKKRLAMLRGEEILEEAEKIGETEKKRKSSAGT